MTATIRATGLVKRYGREGATVLDGIDLRVDAGEFVTIMSTAQFSGRETAAFELGCQSPAALLAAIVHKQLRACLFQAKAHGPGRAARP